MRPFLVFLAALIVAVVGFRVWANQTKIEAYYIGLTNDFQIITTEGIQAGDYVSFTKGNWEISWHARGDSERHEYFIRLPIEILVPEVAAEGETPLSERELYLELSAVYSDLGSFADRTDYLDYYFDVVRTRTDARLVEDHIYALRGYVDVRVRSGHLPFTEVTSPDASALVVARLPNYVAFRAFYPGEMGGVDWMVFEGELFNFHQAFTTAFPTAGADRTSEIILVEELPNTETPGVWPSGRYLLGHRDGARVSEFNQEQLGRWENTQIAERIEDVINSNSIITLIKDQDRITFFNPSEFNRNINNRTPVHDVSNID